MYNARFTASLYSYSAVLHSDFLQKHEGYTFYTDKAYHSIKKISLFDLIDMIKHKLDTMAKLTNKCSFGVSAVHNDDVAVFGTVSATPFFIAIHASDQNQYKAAEIHKKNDVTITISSSKFVTTHLIEWLDKSFAVTKKASIDWWFKPKDGGSDYVSIPMEESFSVKEEAYPFLWKNGRGAYDYFQDYLDSNASLLFLAGPPGTGKTSYLKAMISHYDLRAAVTYDINLLQKDDMFISFITGGTDLLILEDAEAYITSREEETNALMARFLNVSNGLIDVKNKKIIFTTNFKAFPDIDAALTRPGRCYDFAEFRGLNWDEATEFCDSVNIMHPGEAKDYTIAELYNQGHIPVAPKKKVGFR